MAIPSNLSIVTVTGTYLDIAGNPIAGQVKFTPRAVLKNVTSNVVLINSTITVTLDSNGFFSQQLVATDDSDASPLNFTYFVEEAFVGGRSYDILLPAAVSTIDVADIAPALADTGSGALYVNVSDFNALDARVTVVEAASATSNTFFADMNTALTAAVANSNNSIAAVNSYINTIGNIQDNGILYPSKAF
jgi:hypothetical protein